MSKYLNRLNQSADESKKAQAVTAEAHAKASVEQELSRLTARRATLNAAYESALGANPFSVEKVVSLTKELAANEADSKLVKSILDSEFGN